MTGHEPDCEALFEQIEEREALTEAYRDVLRRECALHRKPRNLPYRAAAKVWRTLRRLQNRTSEEMQVEGDLALDRQVARERKGLYLRDARIVVYTVLFGSYDVVREPLFAPDNIDYVLITDQPAAESSQWMRLDAGQVPAAYRDDPVLANRWCKMHPHLLFPTYDYSIYVDANIWVFSDLTPLTAGLDRYPVAMFRHKHRMCVYDEVKACIVQKKDDPQTLKAYGRLLRSRGIPRRWGLLEASVIARRHNDPTCVSLMDAWWEAFLRNSRRDQISLIDCLWTAGIEPQRIGTLGSNLQQCRLFLQMGHLGPNASPQPRTLDELLACIGDNA